MTETEMTAAETAETETPEIETIEPEMTDVEPTAEHGTEARSIAETEVAPEPPKAAAKASKPSKAERAPTPARGTKAAAVAEPAEAPAMPEAAGAPEAVTAPDAAPATRSSGPHGLRLRYSSEVVPALVKQFEYANPNQVPKLEKIVVNVGLGEALSNAKAIDSASGDLTMITGQKPIVTRARRSIAQFKIRTGNPIGLKVTLRGQRMWDFLERLTLLTLPRIRDFRGVPSRSFDGRGNYSLGMREQIAFPEIDYDKVDRLRGLEVSIVTTAKSDEESKRLLELLGMPFAG
jgi:large subunit ribosomal protein L5